MVTHTNKNATRKDLIHIVTALFTDMGSCDATAEERRLTLDRDYFDTWVLDLPEWCPGVADYVGYEGSAAMSTT